jgi:hypothetical protein
VPPEHCSAPRPGGPFNQCMSLAPAHPHFIKKRFDRPALRLRRPRGAGVARCRRGRPLEQRGLAAPGGPGSERSRPACLPRGPMCVALSPIRPRTLVGNRLLQSVPVVRLLGQAVVLPRLADGFRRCFARILVFESSPGRQLSPPCAADRGATSAKRAAVAYSGTGSAAKRNPRPLPRSSGAFLPRRVRQSQDAPYHAPPRLMRCQPLAGPRGSTCGAGP